MSTELMEALTILEQEKTSARKRCWMLLRIP